MNLPDKTKLFFIEQNAIFTIFSFDSAKAFVFILNKKSYNLDAKILTFKEPLFFNNLLKSTNHNLLFAISFEDPKFVRLENMTSNFFIDVQEFKFLEKD